MDTGGNLTCLLEDCWAQAVEERYPSLKEFPGTCPGLRGIHGGWHHSSRMMEDAGLADDRVYPGTGAE
jgi:hypothetical protein